MKIKLFTIPNVLTLANLFCGSLAIVFTLRFGDLRTAFIFVMAAAVFDFLDGFAARLLKSYSEVGKQLDSLADMVSFGAAPAMVLYTMYMSEGGLQWWAPGVYLPFLVALFSALRLAKFNVDENQTEEFVGMPTPACAIFVMSAGYLYGAGIYSVEPLWIIVASVVLSWLLISPIRMFSLKFKNFSPRDNALRYVFLLLSAVSLGAFRLTALPFIMAGYVVLSTVRHLVCSKS